MRKSTLLTALLAGIASASLICAPTTVFAQHGGHGGGGGGGFHGGGGGFHGGGGGSFGGYRGGGITAAMADEQVTTEVAARTEACAEARCRGAIPAHIGVGLGRAEVLGTLRRAGIRLEDQVTVQAPAIEG
jgi:hypothetical protein